MDEPESEDRAVKDILSQLVQDKTVLDEVRKIALRGLETQVSGSGGNSSEPAASREVGRRSNIDGNTSKQPSSGNKAMSKTPLQEKASQQATIVGCDEDLTFTVEKDTDAYRNIMSTVKWYRDSFLIGSDFADKRSSDRAGDSENDEIQNNGTKLHITSVHRSNRITIPTSDPSTAMGHPLLLSAAENYIRSIAAVDLLRPYATWAVSSNGPMFQTATQSMAQTIPLAQSSCDWAMRENMLWMLKDAEWREFAKNITTTYVDRSYKDG